MVSLVVVLVMSMFSFNAYFYAQDLFGNELEGVGSAVEAEEQEPELGDTLQQDSDLQANAEGSLPDSTGAAADPVSDGGIVALGASQDMAPLAVEEPLVIGNPNWSSALSSMGFTIPGNAEELMFSGVSANGQTVLDYVYLVPNGAEPYLLFLAHTASSVNDLNSALSTSVLEFAGNSTSPLKTSATKPIDYAVYKLAISETMMNGLIAGNSQSFSLHVLNKPGNVANGHSIIGSSLKIQLDPAHSISFSVEHYTFDFVGADDKPINPGIYQTTVAGGLMGTTVQATPVAIAGYTLTKTALTVSEGTLNGEGLVLKLFYQRNLQWYITGESAEYTYDGNAKSISGFGAFLSDGTAFESLGLVIAGVKGTYVTLTDADVAWQAIDLEGFQIMTADGVDVTAQLGMPSAIDNGALTINPLEITITVASSSKDVNTPDPDFTATVTAGMLSPEPRDWGEIVCYRTNSDVDAVGSYAAVLDVASHTFGGNYSVTIVKGDFTIKALDVVFDLPILSGYIINHIDATTNAILWSESALEIVGVTVFAVPMTIDGFVYDPTNTSTLAAGEVIEGSNLVLSLYYTPETDEPPVVDDPPVVIPTAIIPPVSTLIIGGTGVVTPTLIETFLPVATPATAQIADQAAPQAGFTIETWALGNLILSVVGILIAAVTFIVFFSRRSEEVDANGKTTKSNKKFSGSIASIILAILAVIVFILTQDMTLPMIMVDGWTLTHVIITILQIVLMGVVFSKVRTENLEESVA